MGCGKKDWANEFVEGLTDPTQIPSLVEIESRKQRKLEAKIQKYEKKLLKLYRQLHKENNADGL